jgi:hypothetical protein
MAAVDRVAQGQLAAMRSRRQERLAKPGGW